MSQRLSLTEVALTGPDDAIARVIFSSGLTVIQGPSDTGKSYIADVIDFMLGSSSLRRIPESAAYTHAQLGMVLSDGRSVSLRRKLSGGNIELLEVTTEVTNQATTESSILGYKHRADDVETLSGFLLRELGLLGRMIRRNKNNKLVSLSFRDVAHLVVIDEISIQAEAAPALTGQYTTATKETSALRALLEDTDDSDLIEVEDKSERKKITGGQIRLVESMLARLELEVRDIPDRDDLRDQWARLATATEQATDARKGVFAERDALGEARSRAIRRTRAKAYRIAELSETRERLSLLLAQYESDINRLDLLGQATDALSYFAADRCAYCGAPARHQHEQFVIRQDEGASVDVLGAERQRTARLAQGLRATMSELEQELESQRRDELDLRSTSSKLDQQFSAAEKAAVPMSNELRKLVATRSQVQRNLSLYDQIEELETTRRLVELDGSDGATGATEGLNRKVADEFTVELVTTLTNWGYPHAKTVHYDTKVQDIWADGQHRSSHGKGVRALLHAAFTVSLAQYCLQRDLPHPGFIVLDSPLITYRPANSSDVDVAGPVAVAEMMYLDLANRFAGQAIVMENVDVPDGFDSDVGVVEFSGAVEVKRYGFLARTTL
jgi:hypothetical protein